MFYTEHIFVYKLSDNFMLFPHFRAAIVHKPIWDIHTFYNFDTILFPAFPRI